MEIHPLDALLTKFHKQTHLKMMMDMANADGRIDEREIDFLLEVATKMGLGKGDFTEISENPENFHIQVPKDESERLTLFYQVLFLMKVDNEIVDKEIELCKAIGIKLGINPLLIADLINLMITCIDKKISQEEMLSKVRPYLN